MPNDESPFECALAVVAGAGAEAGAATADVASTGARAFVGIGGPAVVGVSTVLRTTRTIRSSGVSSLGRRRVVLPSLYAQFRSTLALNSRPLLNCSDVSPLSRQPSIRSAHFCSLAVMSPGMRQPVVRWKHGLRATDTIALDRSVYTAYEKSCQCGAVRMQP